MVKHSTIAQKKSDPVSAFVANNRASVSGSRVAPAAKTEKFRANVVAVRRSVYVIRFTSAQEMFHVKTTLPKTETSLFFIYVCAFFRRAALV